MSVPIVFVAVDERQQFLGELYAPINSDLHSDLQATAAGGCGGSSGDYL